MTLTKLLQIPELEEQIRLLCESKQTQQNNNLIANIITSMANNYAPSQTSSDSATTQSQLYNCKYSITSAPPYHAPRPRASIASVHGTWRTVPPRPAPWCGVVIRNRFLPDYNTAPGAPPHNIIPSALCPVFDCLSRPEQPFALLQI